MIIEIIAELLSSFLIISLIAIALLWIFGVKGLEKYLRLVIIFALIISFLPIVCQLIVGSLQTPNTSLSSAATIILFLILGVILFIAFIHFVRHLRQFKKWRGEKQTSLKRRVERE